jgi:type I restriction enzyme S subunit
LHPNVPPLRFPEFHGEWEKCKLGELAVKVGSGSTPKGGNAVYTTSGHCFVRSQNVGMGHLILNDIAYIDELTHQKQKSTELRTNDVLLNITGASIGRTALATEEINGGNVNQHVCIIRTNGNVEPSFICDYIQTSKIQKYIQSLQTGGSREGLNFEQIRSFPINIPTVEEQVKIAKLLSLINERIATQSKLIEDLKKLKSAIIDYAINSLDTDFAKFSSLYEMAGEGGTPTTSNASFYDNGKIPFVKIDDLKKKYLTENKDFITELGLQKSSVWLVPTRSILFSNGATIGEITITTYPVCTKQGILGIVPKPNIDVEFLYYFMSSSYFRKAVSRIVTEGTMKTAYLKDINNIRCPIPKKEKQLDIAKMPSALNFKIDFEQSILKLFGSQKQYLLRQMFM